MSNKILYIGQKHFKIINRQIYKQANLHKEIFYIPYYKFYKQAKFEYFYIQINFKKVNNFIYVKFLFY